MKLKKICLGVFIYAFTLLVTQNIYAASSINSGAQTVEVGQRITITATVSDVASWNMKINSSGPIKYISGTLQSADATEDASNGSKTISAIFEATGEGTASFSLTGDTTTASGINSGISGKSINVTIKTKTVTPPPPPSQNPSTPPSNGGNTNTKSSNAYLKTLQVNQEGLSPNFSKSKYSYSLTVNGSVNSINVTAVAEDSKAKVSVSGNNDLKNGDNTINIVVTAENGAKKTYKILVNKTDNAENSNAYLENLIIENAKLTADFESEVLEYTLDKVPFSIKQLVIKAFPKTEGAKVEILGNDALVDGENTVTIKITSKDGQIVREYVIKFERELDPSVVANTGISDENPSDISKLEDTTGFMANMKIWYNTAVEAIVNNPLIFILYGFVLVEFIQILYLFKKLKKVDNKVVGVIEHNKERDIDKKIVAKEVEKHELKIDGPKDTTVNEIHNIDVKKDSGIGSLDDILKNNNIPKRDDPVIVKSVDFNTSYDPASFLKPNNLPKRDGGNSYDEYIRSKENEAKKEKNAFDSDDDLNI